MKQNFDVQIAASRILQAQEQVVITRSNQFPTASFGPGVGAVRQPGVPGAFAQGYSYVADQLAFSGSWNIDFWGRYRRATEAARANLRATEWGRRAVLRTLVAIWLPPTFSCGNMIWSFEIAQRTLASREQSLKLTQTLEQGGATSLADVRQAEQLVEEAAESIPDTERAIQQEENQISILVGENPRAIERGKAITEQPLPRLFPPGFRPVCSNAGRIFSRPNRNWLRRTLRSESRALNCSHRSR